jgi:hypothetical protein
MLLSPDSRESKNSFFPSSTLALVVGLSFGAFTFFGNATSSDSVSGFSARDKDDTKTIKQTVSQRVIEKLRIRHSYWTLGL